MSKSEELKKVLEFYVLSNRLKTTVLDKDINFSMANNIYGSMILALGMMIDSSIIVTENISQYRDRGYSLKRACIAGTNEVITPMLSSSLTTIAVFVPLVFMSGIAGAIFFDQAFSVTIGLMVSYFTGIILLPVLYMLVYRAGIQTRIHFKHNRFRG